MLREIGIKPLGRRTSTYNKPAPITDDERTIAALYSQGAKPKDLAAQFPHVRIETALQRTGTRRRPRGETLRRPDDEALTAKVATLYTDGAGPFEIARLIPEIGRPSKVYRYLKRAGISPRGGKGGRPRN